MKRKSIYSDWESVFVAIRAYALDYIKRAPKSGEAEYDQIQNIIVKLLKVGLTGQTINFASDPDFDGVLYSLQSKPRYWIRLVEARLRRQGGNTLPENVREKIRRRVQKNIENPNGEGYDAITEFLTRFNRLKFETMGGGFGQFSFSIFPKGEEDNDSECQYIVFGDFTFSFGNDTVYKAFCEDKNRILDFVFGKYTQVIGWKNQFGSRWNPRELYEESLFSRNADAPIGYFISNGTGILFSEVYNEAAQYFPFGVGDIGYKFLNENSRSLEGRVFLGFFYRQGSETFLFGDIRLSSFVQEATWEQKKAFRDLCEQKSYILLGRRYAKYEEEL